MSWSPIFITRVATPFKIHSLISNLSWTFPHANSIWHIANRLVILENFFAHGTFLHQKISISPICLKNKNRNKPRLLSLTLETFFNVAIISKLIFPHAFANDIYSSKLTILFLIYISLIWHSPPLPTLSFSLAICPLLHFHFIISTSKPSL